MMASASISDGMRTMPPDFSAEKVTKAICGDFSGTLPLRAMSPKAGEVLSLAA